MNHYLSGKSPSFPGWMKWTLCAALLAGIVGGCADNSVPSPRQQAANAYRKGEWRTVLATAGPLLKQYPEDVDLLTWRGQSNVALARYRDAISDFTRIIRINPRDPEGYYLRQMAYARSGQEALADADGVQAKQLDPSHQTAYAFDPSNFREPMDPSLLIRKKTNNEDIDKGEVEERESKIAQSDDDESSTDPWGRSEKDVKENTNASTFAANPSRERKSPTTSTADSLTTSRNKAANKLKDWRREDVTAEVPSEKKDSFGAGMSAVNPQREAVVERTPQAPRGPEAPGAEFRSNLDSLSTTRSQPSAAAGDSRRSRSAIDDWVSKNSPGPAANRLAERNRDRREAAREQDFEAQPEAPAYFPPAISTSLPPGATGLSAAPGPIAGAPTTGLPSAPSALSSANPGITSGARSTGISSAIPNGILGAPGIVGFKPYSGATGLSSSLPSNLQVGQPQPAGILPGQFQGNTLYQRGTRPVLSTSLPGAAQPFLNGAVSSGGVVSGGVATPIGPGTNGGRTPLVQPGRVQAPLAAPRPQAAVPQSSGLPPGYGVPR